MEDDCKPSGEPILAQNDNRFVLFPIQHANLFQLYKDHVASFWTVEEVDLHNDRTDFLKLNDDEQHFVLMVLAFFAALDGIVTENLVLNFAHEIQIPEARCFYAFQAAMENIHGEMYAVLIDTYLAGQEEKKQRIFQAIQTVPSIARKAKWALNWFDKKKQGFASRLIAFACIEGIFFSSSFCAIFWLKQKGILPGLAFSNELISRDEGLHCKFACELQKLLLRKEPNQVALRIVREAVAIECDFVKEALPVALLGMNSAEMCNYVKFCADRLLKDLGYEKIFGTKNPFQFMETISLTGKTNFFEKKVGEYAKSGVGGPYRHSFDMDADF